MDITVNQQTYTVSPSCSLQEALTAVFSQPATGIAIAVNQEIISKSSWDSYALQPRDNITVIKATQGG